jgi:polysaccharide biosynthesis transport protein
MNERFLPQAPGDQRELLVTDSSREIDAWEQESVEAQQSPFHLPNLARILLRWRWLFLSVAVAVTLLATAWAAMQTPLYRAGVTLELNPSPAQVVQLSERSEAGQSDRDYLALQIGLVRSRQLGERVARRLNLGADEGFVGAAAGTPNGQRAAVGRLMDNFSAAGTASDRILQISYVDPNPNTAARIVNTYAEQAVDSTFERGYEATARSRAFLQRRLESTRQELERSERELIGYGRAANIVNVSAEGAAASADAAGGTLVASNLLALNAQLAEAQNARIVAQQAFAQAGAAATSASTSDSTVQSLEQQRAQIQAEYDQKSERYLPDYPEMVALRARIQGLQRQIVQASSRTSSSVTGSLRANLVAAQNRERDLQTKINQLQSQLHDLGDRGVQYTILRRAVESQRSLYNALLERLGEENSAGTRTSSMALIDSAEPPGAPFFPNLPRTMILGLLGGVLLGGGAAVGAEMWRDTIDMPDDLREKLSITVLGVVPKIPSKSQFDDHLLDPKSSVAEAYHSIRTSIQFANPGGRPRSILITSARASEGKTSSVIAIAADYVNLGASVVVVDADMRKPSLQGEKGLTGLAGILSGVAHLETELVHTHGSRLSLIQAGPIPPDPTVLLASPRMRQLVKDLQHLYDVVIFDGPPVMGLADAPLLASLAEMTVMVVESGATRRSAALNAIRRLRVAGANLAGGILTKFDHKSQGYGYGYGGYEYDYDYAGGGSPKRALLAPQGAVDPRA